MSDDMTIGGYVDPETGILTPDPNLDWSGEETTDWSDVWDTGEQEFPTTGESPLFDDADGNGVPDILEGEPSWPADDDLSTESMEKPWLSDPNWTPETDPDASAFEWSGDEPEAIN